MKKYYLLVYILICNLVAFSRPENEKHDLSSWLMLLMFGIVFITYMAHLFFKARRERAERQQLVDSVAQEESTGNNEPKNEKVSSLSDDLFKLFSLKKKGVISESEYRRLKERVIKGQAL